LKTKVAERRAEILKETRERAQKSEGKRLEQMDTTRGRKVKQVEDDAFFVEEEVEVGDYEKREVDKRGNVL
jgi:hypothetical protein